MGLARIKRRDIERSDDKLQSPRGIRGVGPIRPRCHHLPVLFLHDYGPSLGIAREVRSCFSSGLFS